MHCRSCKRALKDKVVFIAKLANIADTVQLVVHLVRMYAMLRFSQQLGSPFEHHREPLDHCQLASPRCEACASICGPISTSLASHLMGLRALIILKQPSGTAQYRICVRVIVKQRHSLSRLLQTLSSSQQMGKRKVPADISTPLKHAMFSGKGFYSSPRRYAFMPSYRHCDADGELVSTMRSEGSKALFDSY